MATTSYHYPTNRRVEPRSSEREDPTLRDALRLVVPSSSEVAEFHRLFFECFSLELTPDEALETATAYLHMFQILTHER